MSFKSECSYHLNLSTFFTELDSDYVGYEWELNIKDKDFNKIKTVATAEIRPCLFKEGEYEVFFSDDFCNWNLGQSCSLNEANSRVTNAIEKYKRNGTLDNVYEYSRFFSKNKE